MKFSLLLYALITFILSFSAEYILKLIGYSETFVSGALWSVMVLMWFLERQQAFHAQIYMTTNKIPFYFTYTLTGVVQILLLLLFLNFTNLNIWSVVLAQLISNLLINNWYNVYISLKSLQVGFIKYFKDILWLPLTILILGVFL